MKVQRKNEKQIIIIVEGLLCYCGRFFSYAKLKQRKPKCGDLSNTWNVQNIT